METAVIQLLRSRHQTSLCFTGGYFADRIAEMGRRQSAQVVSVKKEWGETFTQAEAEEAIERERPQVVAFVHGETSTGTLQDPATIGKPAQKGRSGALTIADCVTSLGANPVRVDASPTIDIAYSCTQKCLSCPPGLSPLHGVGSRGGLPTRPVSGTTPIWYLDLKLLLEILRGPTGTITRLRSPLLRPPRRPCRDSGGGRRTPLCPSLGGAPRIRASRGSPRSEDARGSGKASAEPEHRARSGWRRRRGRPHGALLEEHGIEVGAGSRSAGRQNLPHRSYGTPWPTKTGSISSSVPSSSALAGVRGGLLHVHGRRM